MCMMLCQVTTRWCMCNWLIYVFLYSTFSLLCACESVMSFFLSFLLTLHCWHRDDEGNTETEIESHRFNRDYLRNHKFSTSCDDTNHTILSFKYSLRFSIWRYMFQLNRIQSALYDRTFGMMGNRIGAIVLFFLEISLQSTTICVSVSVFCILYVVYDLSIPLVYKYKVSCWSRYLSYHLPIALRMFLFSGFLHSFSSQSTTLDGINWIGFAWIIITVIQQCACIFCCCCNVAVDGSFACAFSISLILNV